MALRMFAKSTTITRSWKLREVNDDLRLLRMMVDGTWNEEEFLILKPGERIAPDYTGLKLRAEPDPDAENMA